MSASLAAARKRRGVALPDPPVVSQNQAQAQARGMRGPRRRAPR